MVPERNWQVVHIHLRDRERASLFLIIHYTGMSTKKLPSCAKLVTRFQPARQFASELLSITQLELFNHKCINP